MATRILSCLLPTFFCVLLAEGIDSQKNTQTLLTDVQWIERTELPYPLKDHMVAALTDSGLRAVYVVGGRRLSTGQMEQSCLRYVPALDRWFVCRQMRYPRGMGQAVGLRRRIYVIGGCRDSATGSNRVEAYDPAQNLWYTQSNLPRTLCDFAATAWRDSLVFVIGGTLVPYSRALNQVLFFDPRRNVWDSATPLPFSLAASAAAAIEDSIYVLCGTVDSGVCNLVIRGIINPSDPRQIEWGLLAPLPASPRVRPVGASLGTSLLLCGGILADGSIAQETWQFTPGLNLWTRLPDKPTPITAVSSGATIGNRVYFPGGLSGLDLPRRHHHVLDLGGYGRDVGFDSVLSPAGRLEIGAIYSVRARIRNYGTGPDTAMATARLVDTVTGQLAFQADITVFLDSGESRVVDFGSFIPSYRSYWLVSASAHSLYDQNFDNDTARQYCRTNSASQPDAYGYVYRSTQEPDTIIFNWVDTAGGTVLTGWWPNPDDGVLTRTLPFRFPFYGRSLTQLTIATDGYLQTSTLSCPRNQPLPFPVLPDLIAPYWDDLTLREKGRVVESRSDSTVTYTWCGVPHYNAPLETLTFQVVLHSSGTIEFNYLQLTGDKSSATVGIQDGDGSWSRYLEYVYNGKPETHLLHDSVSIIFSCERAGIISRSNYPASASRCFSFPTIYKRGQSSTFNLRHTPKLTTVEIFDATGRLLRTLRLRGSLSSDHSKLPLDLCDEEGRCLNAGTYFVCLRSGSQQEVGKLVLLR